MFMSNGACFTPYSPTWAVFFWMYQSGYTGSTAYMILPTQQKLTLLRRVGLQNIHKVGHPKMLSCTPRPASCFWEWHPWRHFASSHLQDIILANPKPRISMQIRKVVPSSIGFCSAWIFFGCSPSKDGVAALVVATNACTSAMFPKKGR